VVLSWNVRGLGQSDKRVVVKDNIDKNHPQLVCLQETKLNAVDSFCFRSFITPPNLDAFRAKPADDTRGGLVTASCSSLFTLVHHDISAYTITVVLQSTTSDVRLALTNVYGPADHAFTDQFLSDLSNVASTINDPWLIIGDFNLTRAPSDKNTTSFNTSLASRFNQMIDDLQLIELLVLDRLFTWTNKRAEPTLARLDRASLPLNSETSFLAPLSPPATVQPLIILQSLPPSKLIFLSLAFSDWRCLGSWTPPSYTPFSLFGSLSLALGMMLVSWLHRSRRLRKHQRFGCVSIAPPHSYTITATSSFAYLTTWKNSNHYLQVNVVSRASAQTGCSYSSARKRHTGSSGEK
jgi:exonuclease III